MAKGQEKGEKKIKKVPKDKLKRVKKVY